MVSVIVSLSHAEVAKSAEFYFPFVFHACAGVVENFVTTRVRREFRVSDERFYPPPPHCVVLHPVSGGESGWETLLPRGLREGAEFPEKMALRWINKICRELHYDRLRKKLCEIIARSQR